MRKWIIIFVLAVAAAGGGLWYWRAGSQADPIYKSAAIKRGDVVATINATGTLEPQEVVDVGAQVDGLIVSFGKDSTGNSIDYRSPVQANMILASVDDTVYKADVDTAAAQLKQSKAAVLKGQADLAQNKALLHQAEGNWNRAKAMGPSDALSQNDYDMYQANYETALANVTVAQTEIAQAESGVDLAQAALDKAKRDLEFCTIRSPVDGVIIDRRVSIGQTVVSSLNAPSLFLIAKDLRRMQIWVSVNEADIGRIVTGAPVTFSCDAFPNQVFQGRVGKVRLNATMTQNVVMYTVEVEAANPDNILLPYLTAKVQFEVQKQSNALLVPNAALRWNPVSVLELAPDVRSTLTKTDAAPDPSTGSAAVHASSHASKESHAMVWVKDGQFVRPIDVKLGTTDGVTTAIASDKLHEGDEVITSEIIVPTDAGQRSPFLPQMIRR